MTHHARPLAGLFLAMALVAPALPAMADHGGIHVPDALVGDQAAYEVAGTSETAFALEWLEPEETRDRWGRQHTVDVLRTLLPPGAKPPDPDRDWVPSDDWAEYRDAFAGTAQDPVWRLDPRNWFQNRTEPLLLVQAGLENHAETRLAFIDYAPLPGLRSCLVHHGLQGRQLTTGSAVPLQTLCPAVGGLVEADLRQARGTTFLGRPAVEFLYGLDSAAPVFTHDLDLPARGTLRVVVADGLPFLGELQVLGERPDDGWHYALSGFERGDGPVVRPWLPGAGAEPSIHPDARLEPLGPDGPPDGGSGLPYPLEDALAQVRRDATLAGFQAWRRDHPDAFVMLAQLKLRGFYPGTDTVWVDRSMGTQAEWTIAFASGRPDGTLDTFAVASRWSRPHDLPLLGDDAPPVVRNSALGPGMGRDAVAPSGALAIDLASALRIFRSQVPAFLGDLPIVQLEYQAPRPGGLASLRVLGQRQESQVASASIMQAAELDLDPSSGAASTLALSQDQQGWGPLTLRARPLTATSDVGSPLLAQVQEAQVLTLTGAALLAALLAHGGYLTVAYSRLRQSDLLDHPARQRIYALVRERPGIHFHAVVAATGIGAGTTMYHLHVLERGSLVTRVSLRKFRRYYVTGSVPHHALRARAELASASARVVYDAVRREPGMTMAELARRVQVSPVAVHRTVERLREAGLVEKRPHGRLVRVVPRDGGPN